MKKFGFAKLAINPVSSDTSLQGLKTGIEAPKPPKLVKSKSELLGNEGLKNLLNKIEQKR